MLSIILTGHGGFASGMEKAMKQILGEQSQFIAIDFPETSSTAQLTSQLEEAIAKVKGIEGTLERAKGARDQILPLMGKIREDSDALEAIVDDKLWELPKYSELLWVH